MHMIARLSTNKNIKNRNNYEAHGNFFNCPNDSAVSTEKYRENSEEFFKHQFRGSRKLTEFLLNIQGRIKFLIKFVGEEYQFVNRRREYQGCGEE